MQQAERISSQGSPIIGLNWKTFGVAAIIVAVIWFGWQQFAPAQEAATLQSGDSASAFIGNLSTSATASGRVEAIQTANVSVASWGVVTDLFVEAGEIVAAGDPLLQMETANLQIQLERAEQAVALQEANLAALINGSRPEDIAAAEASVASAQAALDQLLAGPTEFEIAEYEANLRADQANVASAAATYNSTLSSVTDAQIAQAEIDVANAQSAYNDAVDINESFATGANHDAMMAALENLEVAQQALSELLAGPSQGSLTNAAGNVSAANAGLNGTQADYEALLAGATAQQIASAEASLAQAEANLANLIDAASVESITIAEEQLRQAEIALLNAQDNLAEATLTAPFAGTITAVNINTGEFASGNVIEIVSNELKVVLEVDELDIAQIAVGQTAALDLETWPGEEIPGEVVSIAPSSSAVDGVANFDVTIAVGKTDLPIRVGMTANANLVTADFSDLLLVPSAAITADRTAETYTVNRITTDANGDASTETVDVTIGLRDDTYTEITSGLNQGDEVIIGELVAPVEDGGFGPPGR